MAELKSGGCKREMISGKNPGQTEFTLPFSIRRLPLLDTGYQARWTYDPTQYMEVMFSYKVKQIT